MDNKNSMLHDVQELLVAIFEDLNYLHPSISTDLKRDLSRLLKAAVSVGLPFYTITLPSVCKWFDKSLSDGRLIDTRPPHFGVKGKSDRRPMLLHGLFSGIFEPNGTLRSEVDVSYVASMRQVLLFAKKLDMKCEDRYTNECVSEFHEIERSLPPHRQQTWNSDIPCWSHPSGHPIWGNRDECDSQTHLFDVADPLLQLDFEPDWEGFRRFSAGILHQLGQFNPYKVRSKHGPGAVSDRVEGFVKYDLRHWSDRLEQVFPYDWHASTDLSVPDYVLYKEFASKMHAVPKTQKGPRLIAAEPIAHQWIQQGICDWLMNSMHGQIIGNCVDLSDQTLSMKSALEASESGLFATVDLSSASDRLTGRLVEYIFQSRHDLLDAFHACRSRALVDIHGQLVLLKKFSTQGSALTMPVQSICYALLAMWSVMLTYRRTDFASAKWASLQVRVYGDDIIIPVDAYPVLAGLLKTCLLKVNVSKTHNSGYFRESCGMDAYAGTDVTPAYLRKFYSSAPENLESLLQCSNNFHMKGMWRAAAHLLSTVPENERKLIPTSALKQKDISRLSAMDNTDLQDGPRLGSTSISSFCGVDLRHLRSRWSDTLHKTEYRALVVSAKTPLKSGSGNGPLTQFFNEEPDPLLPYKAGEAGQPRHRKTARWVS